MRIVSTVGVQRHCILDTPKLFAEGLEACLAKFEHVVVVFDENTKRFQDEIQASIETIGLRSDCITLNSHGEPTKSLDTYLKLVRQVATFKFLRRKSCFIAVGGGSVTDLVGYVAATYQRGVSYINIPTTLLGMVDASIGGKVGINYMDGKHLLGAFHYPNAVLIDTNKLASLSQRAFEAAFAEIVKVALIAGEPDLFEYLETYAEHAKARRLEVLDSVVAKSIEIKLRLVEPDWQEEKLDRLLNLGHEIAHALEGATSLNDESLMHGEAVMLGVLSAAELAKQRGVLTETIYNKITTLLRRLCSCTSMDRRFDMKEILSNLERIKQIRDGNLRVVLPYGRIGTARVFHDIESDELIAALKMVDL